MTPFAQAEPERRSLFGEILDWMLAPLLVLWPLSLALTWLVAEHVANLPYDRALAASVNALAKRVHLSADGASMELALADATLLLRAEETDRVYYQVLGLRGELIAGDRDLPVAVEETGPDDVHWRDEDVQGERVRVAYRWVSLRPELPRALVQVGETRTRRAQLATDIVKAVVLPEFVILPLAVLLVWLALARGLAPLHSLQQRLRARASNDLSPIDEREAPEEVSPLVAGINELLARQKQAMLTHKRFLANAAHQLKTPLAGLRTQAEWAQRELSRGLVDPSAIKDSLQQMARATQGATRMVNQLLAMARAEARSTEMLREPVDLAALAEEVVRDFVPRALDKRIDLGYEGPGHARIEGSRTTPAPTPSTQVIGHPTLLREMLVNLVDNALQYTPAGGAVTLRLLPDPFGQVVVVQVEDSGPGIAVAERELVFQPFYRTLGSAVEGSGLGLAIVAEVVHQHGGSIALDDARPHTAQGVAARQPDAAGVGALFTVRLPAARPGGEA